MNDWLFEGTGLTVVPEGNVGFVYLITNKTNGMKYIGKKNMFSTRRLKPLKGKKRKRVVTKESAWQDYYGSSLELCEEIETLGKNNYIREILKLCQGKGEMSYYEAKCQFDYDVLLRDDFYNGHIQCRIHHTHVNKLKYSITPQPTPI